MKRIAMTCALAFLLFVSGTAAGLEGLKGMGQAVGRSIGKSAGETAKATALDALTKKLKGVQNRKGPIRFVTGKAEIDPGCDPTMTAIAAILADHPGFRVQVDGHTDNVGDPEANMRLSQGRAEAVVAYLVGKKGADGRRLSARGFGDTRPLADNATKKGQAKNRRVDFTVTDI